MDEFCDCCSCISLQLVECCNNHSFCPECMVKEGHGTKFTCNICTKEKCSTYNHKNGMCFSCYIEDSCSKLVLKLSDIVSRFQNLPC